MPTILEIKEPHMKYCQEKDTHCSCPTCLDFKTCPHACKVCTIDENHIKDLVCHSRPYHKYRKTNKTALIHRPPTKPNETHYPDI